MRDSKAVALLLLLFFLAFSRIPVFSYDKKLILLTTKGLRVSENNGHSWSDLSRGLPDSFIPLKIQSDESGNLYLLTYSSGIFKLGTDKKRWDDISLREFREPSVLSKPAYRKITGFAVNGSNGSILLAAKHAVFRKDAGGWTRLSVLSGDNYYTALAAGNDAVYAGTSCNGLYKAARIPVNISSGLPKERYSKKRVFYEEIAAIELSKKNPDIIYAALNFGGGIYFFDGGIWRSLEMPVRDPLCEVFDMKAKGDSLFVSTGDGIFRMDENRKWHSVSMEGIRELSSKRENLGAFIMDSTGKCPSLFYRLNSHTTGKKPLMAKSMGKKALYANSYSLSKNLSSHVETIKKCGLNAIVIDVKDDWGDICFKSGNATARSIGAVKKYYDIKKSISILKKNDIYAIARIVVFKDKRLYNAFDNKYATWDKTTSSPWKGNPREFWMDPYSDFVRNYNTEIALEAEASGFDEIQFDYIRFPSDGPVGRCSYRFQNGEDIYKSEILAAFLEEARYRISIPVSVDIYGFNAWFRISELVGQDIEKFSEVVDVLCPMAYPSHYGSFLAGYDEHVKPYRIALGTAKRAGKITMNNSVIRPYLQAFNLLSPTWGPDYVGSQIRAALESGTGGYTLWNAGGHYEMLIKAIQTP